MRSIHGSFLCLAALILLFSCNSETAEQHEERLARVSCGSCHAFPEAKWLTKKSWQSSALPEMKFRMGLDPARSLPTSNGLPMIDAIPLKPMVTAEEWVQIQNYYLKNAPDSIGADTTVSYSLTQFDVSPIKVNSELPLICLVQADTLVHTIFVGSRNRKLYEFDDKRILMDSFGLPSPASHILFARDRIMTVSLMGKMDPNDDTYGRIITIDAKARHAKNVLDSLRRPVYFEKLDLNGDQRDDYLACEFGNFKGGLTIYESLPDGQLKRHDLLDLPGARNTIIRDVDQDGKPDIFALFTQGNEQIVLFHNKGDFNFDMQVLLRFPPVYGSSYFDLVDFDHDGKEDILYTNGDNFDFSPILKPYHGVHIFHNDGEFKFTERWFHTLYGASMAMARDFDGDGDVDIAAISFFPDFSKKPERGFMYFENKGSGFAAQTTPLGADGRWLVMDVADIDHDGDQDIILGALDFTISNKELFKGWAERRTGVLVFTNKRF